MYAESETFCWDTGTAVHSNFAQRRCGCLSVYVAEYKLSESRQVDIYSLL